MATKQNEAVEQSTTEPAPKPAPVMGDTTSPLVGKIDFDGAVAIVCEARGMNEAAARVFLLDEIHSGSISLTDKTGNQITPAEFRTRLETI